MSNQNEFAFESNLEEIFNKSGYEIGSIKEYDKTKALFPNHIIEFIKSTQKELWDSVYALQKEHLLTDIIDVLSKELNIKGTLEVLRKGFKYRGKRFMMAYFMPSHGMSKEVVELYGKNKLSFTRQIPCMGKEKGRDSTGFIDITLAINGIPFATIELKNQATYQNYKDAIKQYREDRQPTDLIFEFKKRALVHFAVDTEQVYMTTKLNGTGTHFLPFNRGSHPGQIKCGAGNPIDEQRGYRTGYFFEEVLQRDSIIDIIASFMFVETEEKKSIDKKGEVKTVTKESVIFPRYHQLQSVRKIIATARIEGVGNNYLIQHSAGSGKTKSIAWLSHRLASLHDQNDNLIFDCVVVITDRTVLDKQLQDAIYQIEHKSGVVKPIENDSAELAKALIDGTKIVITTLQKFPFVIKGLLRNAGASSVYNPDEISKEKAKEWERQIANRKYAIVVDEAHSSQSGESIRELKAILGSNVVLDENSDYEDCINAVMESRGKQKSISFFAFTATPKGKTLLQFGRNNLPFDLYSMRQAIEEGFILDVLQHYIEWKTFYKIASKVEEGLEKKYGKKRAAQKVTKFLKLHPTNVSQKAEIIIEHFRHNIMHLLNGQAKAMVVTDSRLSAVKYMKAFQSYLAEHRLNDIRALVAFSGTVKDPDDGFDYTESRMNIDFATGKSISEKSLPERFAGNDYKILLVANKYQTGFDEPLLCAMYVDKRLDGVQAVQTLSRLNRCYPGKAEPFVLDFVNNPADIYTAFKAYYDCTQLGEETDPMKLEEIKTELDNMRVYTWQEIHEFAYIFYQPVEKQKFSDHANMEGIVQKAKERFDDLEIEYQQLFRDKLKAFVNLYSFVSQIIDFTDNEWERLYTYGRFLLPHLVIEGDKETENPQDEIILTHLRNQIIAEHRINLKEGEDIVVNAPSEIGSGKAQDEKVPLAIIIQALNEKFGTEFSDEDRLFFQQIKQKAQTDAEVIKKAKTNSYDKFELGIKEIIKKLMITRIQENDDIVTRYLDNPEFQRTALTILASEIFAEINASDAE